MAKIKPQSRQIFRKIFQYKPAVFLLLFGFVGTTILFAVHAAGSGLSSCSSITYNAPSGSANNITFTFDQSYQCGQFANGDWFVVTPSAGGSVVVTNMTPAYASGRNGYDINPDPNQNTQRFNSLMNGFQAPLSLPLQVKNNQSLVKTVSTSGCSGNVNCNQFAAVLTVLDTPPADPANTFRPPYAGSGNKTQFSVGSLQTQLLQRLSSSCCSDKITNAQANSWTKYQRLDYTSNSVDGGGRMETADGAPDGRGWGGDMSRNDVQLVAWLNLDNACTTPPCTAQQDTTAKMPVLVGFVQEGIDLWGTYKNGGGFWRGGGGNGEGKLFNMTFAAAMLNDAGMKSDIANVNPGDFWETGTIYMNKNGRAIWGQPDAYASPAQADQDYWNELFAASPATRTIADPYDYIDGGAVPGGWYEGITADPATYMSFDMRLMPAFGAAWTNVNNNKAAMLDFGDRWHTHGALTLPDPCAPKTGTYGVNYGPNGSGSCITGSGRAPTYDGYKDTGAPRISAFMEEMYTAYRNSLNTSGPKVGDFNNDGLVNITDLSMLLSAWGTTNATINASLGTSGAVNITALSIFLSHWGT